MMICILEQKVGSLQKYNTNNQSSTHRRCWETFFSRYGKGFFVFYKILLTSLANSFKISFNTKESTKLLNAYSAAFYSTAKCCIQAESRRRTRSCLPKYPWSGKVNGWFRVVNACKNAADADLEVSCFAIISLSSPPPPWLLGAAWQRTLLKYCCYKICYLPSNFACKAIVC